MNPLSIFVRRPVATILLTVALVLGGVLGYMTLPVADMPNVDFPVIQVQARQSGGSPEEIASSVAAPLERHLGAIAGLTEMTSQSSANQARITLQFSLDRDINGAARDVEAALQAAHADLPSSLRQNPSYFKANPNGAPVMILALTSRTRTASQLYDLASNVLQQHLSQIQGVGEVEIGGSSLPAVRVEMNPLALYKFGIGFEDIRAALASANAHTPKGFIDQGDHRFTLDTNDQVHNAQAYRDLIVAYHDSRPVRLEDVASVRDSVEDLRNAGYVDGRPAVLAIIFAQAGANIINTNDQIRAKLPLLRAALPTDVDLGAFMDRSTTIRAALADTQFTLVLSVGLVVLVVLLFLRSPRITIIPAIVVPASIITTFGAMKVMGYSIDNLSLMALTISTGFVVDDAIVVVENISRHMEAGMDRVQATLLGTREVAFTVMSITVSLIAVFLPILLLSGVAGRLFHEFAMTMSITIVISMVLSLSLTPMMTARLLRVHEALPSRGVFGRISHGLERGLNAAQQGYARSLEWAITHRRLTILSLPLTIAIMVGLFIKMPKSLFPESDTGMLMGRLMGDQSISFQAMQGKIMTVQKAITADRDVAHVMGFMGGRGSANQANLFVTLRDKSLRDDTPAQTIARIGRRLRSMVGATFYASAPGQLRIGGRQSNAAYQYSLQSDSSKDLYQWTPLLVSALQKHPELSDVSSDVLQGGSALDVQVDRDTASRLNITPQLISNTLYDAYGQRSASVIYNPLNQYHVVMEVQPRFWQDPTTLKQVWVSVAGGTAGGGTQSNTIRVSADTGTTESQLSAQSFRNQVANTLAGGNSASTGSAVSTSSESMVPLTLVSVLKPTKTALSINHDGQSVSSTISFNLTNGVPLSQAVQIINEETVKLHMPANIQGNFAGNAAQFQKSVNNEPLLILAALAAVYMTLGILYESYVHPLTILSTLPSAGVGALLALQFFGEAFSLIAMIGVILLIGIVKKNAIMLVDFAITAERDEGHTALDAIRMACLLRFRPIMMTTFAAALGALPLIFGHGYGSELRRPLGIAIVGGLLVSQALTLYTTPVVYLYLDHMGVACRTYFNRLYGRLSRRHRLSHQQDS
ncbi:nodulation protein [Komagataeibacter rhaeticus]|uniref:efflux RND transporter permease subunit n=1 Tax=Komagataeibacter rhaeticus TaxID=215221 RepID=UPI0004D96C74|nr:efflux RND transporter permease subunit [Komagataeibacter rhaeticus]KDU95769.1 nodulation protein [Komagataeibacter rhaeticus AF1]MBL7239985.1 efflux RND transporter permease subunit [Komagataeibacter rhaeticus]PYD54636.1 nodulation protein [Komagataeibacter rhaeticus]GBQ16004.1 multidrug efflux pump acriflavin resistance protein AcrB/AcrD/AcrF [Komagataeibacter rhaeticus DSM 16663]